MYDPGTRIKMNYCIKRRNYHCDTDASAECDILQLDTHAHTRTFTHARTVTHTHGDSTPTYLPTSAINIGFARHTLFVLLK